MNEQPSRLAQLGELFTAIIAVVLTGQCDLSMAAEGHVSGPIPIAEEFLTGPPYGIYSHVARKLGISVTYTRKVALGKELNDRVALALIEELRNPVKALRPATYANSVILNSSAKFGTYSRVAKELGLSAQHVRAVALGQTTSARVMAALARAAEGPDAESAEVPR